MELRRSLPTDLHSSAFATLLSLIGDGRDFSAYYRGHSTFPARTWGTTAPTSTRTEPPGCKPWTMLGLGGPRNGRTSMKQMAAVVRASPEIPAIEETRAGTTWSGIRALMLAVLDDAMQSLSSSESLDRAAAEHWIASSEHRYVFSFVVICETLGLVPSAVRRSVIDLLRKKRPRKRLLRRSRPNVRHRGAIHLASAHRHSNGKERRPRRPCDAASPHTPNGCHSALPPARVQTRARWL